jgi:Ca-activated chloride channel family protein
MDWYRSLAAVRSFVSGTIADWRALRLDDLQYWHRSEVRLAVLALVGLLLLTAVLRAMLRARPGRQHILLPALPASIAGSRGAGLAHLPLVVFLVGLLFFLLAFADPHTSFVQTETTFPGRRIAVVVDASSSMRRGFIAQNLNPRQETEATFHTAVEAARRFVELRIKGKYRDLMALVEFGNESYVVTPFTNDYDNILLSISLIGDPVEFSLFPDGGNTIISLAVLQSVQLFKAFNFLDASGNLLVIFSDGEDTHAVVNGMSIDQIMQGATLARVPVYFVRTNWGLEAGKMIADNLWMEAVAKTGGKFYAASDESKLLAAVSDIDKVGAGTISVRQYANQQPRFAMFAGAALLCWIAAAALKLGVPYFQKLP